MGLARDTYTLFLRELLIFKKNLGVNIARSLIFPILFIILLGAFGSSPKNIPVALVNYDNGLTSLQFINLLQSGDSIKIVSSTTQQAAMGMLAQGNVAAVIVIPNGFSSSQLPKPDIYMYLDNSQPQSASVINMVVNRVAAQMGTQITSASTALADPVSTPVPVVTNYAYGAASNYESFVVGGIVIMVAAFGSVFSSGFTVLSDRELGNLKAFLTTPINKFAILLSKIGYGTMQSLLSAYIGLAIGLALGATVAAGFLGVLELIWIIFLVGLSFGSLSIALAMRAKQLQTYALIGQSIVMPAAFLGGAFVPVSLLPPLLQTVSIANPLTYAVNAVRDIMIKGSLPIGDLVLDSAVLLVFAGLMLALAFVFFKNTSEQIS
ncbi:MAG: ABC transporter permease [Candidatus Micrarchaeota archaeon]|nr:ABC transporter permease [Candidatus Micrarchaeota archaeon]